MNAKTILGIILVILGFAIYFLAGSLHSLPITIWGCFQMGGYGVNIGCALVNAIPAIIIIIIGVILIYLGKNKIQKNE